MSVTMVRGGDVEGLEAALACDPASVHTRVYAQAFDTQSSRTSDRARTGRDPWDGRCLIHEAVEITFEPLPILDVLAARGADLNVRLKGRTLLHLAAAKGDLEVAPGSTIAGAEASSVAIGRSRPPQRPHASTSTANTRRIRSAQRQPRRAADARELSNPSHCAWPDACVWRVAPAPGAPRPWACWSIFQNPEHGMPQGLLSEDVMVLAKLVAYGGERPSLAQAAGDLSLSPSQVHASLKRLEAFRGRGRGDFLASHDLEDIVTVFDGRAELPGEIAESSAAVRNYIAAEPRALLDNPDFLDALSGFLPPDAASQRRRVALEARLRDSAAI